MRILLLLRKLRIAMAQSNQARSSVERELTVEQPEFGRSARLYVWGGECAKVIDSRLESRDLGLHRNRECTKSDPRFERLAMSGVRSLFR